MAREKGSGNLQMEKSGRWTIRVSINGKRFSRSARTKDRDKAESFLNRFLSPLGLGETRIPLAEAWHRYEMSPNRRDIAIATLQSKRTVWMAFARWMEHYHVEIGDLAQVTEESVSEYLMQFRCNHSATTYNNHVCILREVFRVLAGKAGVTNDPWADVRLRADDSISRRELAVNELERLYAEASKMGLECLGKPCHRRHSTAQLVEIDRPEHGHHRREKLVKHLERILATFQVSLGSVANRHRAIGA